MISESKDSLGTHHHRPGAILDLSSVKCQWHECNGPHFLKDTLVMTTLELCDIWISWIYFYRVHWDCVGATQECVGDYLNVWETSSMCEIFSWNVWETYDVWEIP